jgi:hypothetical protein
VQALVSLGNRRIRDNFRSTAADATGRQSAYQQALCTGHMIKGAALLPEAVAGGLRRAWPPLLGGPAAASLVHIKAGQRTNLCSFAATVCVCGEGVTGGGKSEFNGRHSRADTIPPPRASQATSCDANDRSTV